MYFVSWVYADVSQVEFQPQAVTDADGRFEFRPQPSDLPPGVGPSYWNGSIAATADGFGFGKESSLLFETTGEAIKLLNPAGQQRMKKRLADTKPIIRLAVDDKPIDGQVLNTEGRPVSGATVQVMGVDYSEDGSLDAWQKAAKEPKADFYSTRRTTPEGMNAPQLRAVIPPVKTDAQGKFMLKGIGRERLVELLIRGPGIETQVIKARTQDGELVTMPREWRFRNSGLPAERYHPAEFVHIAAPSKPVIGTVIDGDTNKPVAGVRISGGHQGTFTRGDNPWIVTHTDAQGRYRLEGLPIDDSERLYVFPPDGSRYLPAGASIRTKLDQQTAEKDFVLRKGILIRGRAVDDRTKKPLSGQVCYYSEVGNPHLKKYPGFARFSAEHECRADKQGRFEIPVPPGQGILTFMPDNHGSYQRGVGTSTITVPGEPQLDGKFFQTVPSYLYSGNKHLLRQVELEADSSPINITLEATSGIKVTGRLRDTDGKPLSDCLLNGHINRGTWYQVQGTEFEVEGYYPDRPRDLYFYHPDRDLAGHYLLKGEPPKDLTVTLAKAGRVRGRLLDKDGAPIVGVELLGEGVPGENFGNAKLRRNTDENGQFEIRGLIPGRTYTVNAYGNMVSAACSPMSPSKPAKPRTWATSKSTDRKKRTKPKDTASKAELKPKPTNDEPITVRGQVLLPNGQPAKNATVRAAAPMFSTMTNLLGPDYKPPVSAVQTDAEGRFALAISKQPYGEVIAREPLWKGYWKQ